MIDFSLMPLIQIVWEAGLPCSCKIGILYKFFQVTCISSMEMPHQIAIFLALWERLLQSRQHWPFSSGLSSPLLSESPGFWPGLFSCSPPGFCAFSFCFHSLAITSFLVLVVPGLCLTEEMYFPSRFTFSLDNSDSPIPCYLASDNTLRAV